MTHRSPSMLTLVYTGLLVALASGFLGCGKDAADPAAQTAPRTKDETGVTIDPKDEDYQPPLPPPSEKGQDDTTPPASQNPQG